MPLGTAGTDRRTKKNFQGTYSCGCLASASEGRREFSLSLGGLLLDQQSQPGQKKKALEAKKSLLKPSHFLLSFPPLPLMHRLGKVAKEAGPGDLSRVGGGVGWNCEARLQSRLDLGPFEDSVCRASGPGGNEKWEA